MINFKIKYMGSKGAVLKEQALVIKAETQEEAKKEFKKIKPHTIILEIENETL